MSTTRMAGRRGRLAVKPPAERFAIQYLSSYLTAPLPAPAYPIDVTGGITDWGMLGNGPDAACTSHPNGVGDCTFAGRQHYRMAKAAAGLVFSDVVHHKPQPQGFTRSEDIHTLSIIGAGRLQKRPEVLRFLGSVRPHRLLAKYSADRMGSVYYDPWVRVTRVTPVGAQTVIALQTSSRTYLAEGFLAHNCIVKIGADGAALDTWVTWGAAQRSTLAWTQSCLDEAWVVLTSEDVRAADVDIAALRADIDALHGTRG